MQKNSLKSMMRPPPCFRYKEALVWKPHFNSFKHTYCLWAVASKVSKNCIQVRVEILHKYSSKRYSTGFTRVNLFKKVPQVNVVSHYPTMPLRSHDSILSDYKTIPRRQQQSWRCSFWSRDFFVCVVSSRTMIPNTSNLVWEETKRSMKSD